VDTGMTVTKERSVVDEIDELLEWSRTHESRIGYFAGLYWHVATALHAALEKGEFAHPEWMERVNEEFIGRYLDAVACYRRGAPCSEAWQMAFRATTNRRLVVIQHLLLGANAHINLDLAVGVARAIPPDDMEAFRPDYERMNDVLCSLLLDVINDVGRVLPLIKLVSSFGEREEDVLIGFSIRVARKDAWLHARRLAAMDPEQRDAAIRERDASVAALGRRIVSPGRVVAPLLWLLRLGEVRGIVRTIDDIIHR
jgi:Family of unknown function (DUF5995)